MPGIRSKDKSIIGGYIPATLKTDAEAVAKALGYADLTAWLTMLVRRATERFKRAKKRGRLPAGERWQEQPEAQPGYKGETAFAASYAPRAGRRKK